VRPFLGFWQFDGGQAALEQRAVEQCFITGGVVDSDQVFDCQLVWLVGIELVAQHLLFDAGSPRYV
jgi:hypothetical protein